MAKIYTLAIAAAMALGGANYAQAVITYNDNVTPDMILGTGLTNGGFTVARVAGVELGLRGKLRFDGTNQPQNTFNFTGISGDGHGVYTFDAVGVDPLNGPTPGWADASTPIWNFEWSINVNYDGSASNFDGLGDARDLSDLTYALFIDFNPTSMDVPAVTFDPINVAFADHSIGDNSTANGAGVEAANAAGYAALIGSLSVAQQSWNMEFFDTPASPYMFDPTAAGTYTIRLDAYSGQDLVATTSIDIVAQVPEVSSFLFGGVICGVLGLWQLRQKRSIEEAKA